MAGFPDALPGDTVDWIIPFTNYTITGHSRAGERTGFCLPSFGIFFDAGIHCWNTPKMVFVTHSHTDHSFSLPMITANLEKPIVAYAPTAAVPLIEQHLQATAQLNACSLEIQPVGCTVQGVEPKDQLTVNIKSIRWVVDVVECCHRVPSVGYCVSELRTKLKDEFKGLSGKEIGMLKREGKEIVETVSFKQFVFMGDTTVKVFETHPEVFEYPTIFVECTFIEDNTEIKADKTTHIHWNYLKPFVKQNPQCLFMLIHFSLRWSEKQLEEYFRKEAQNEGITNLGFWFDSGVVVLSD